MISRTFITSCIVTTVTVAVAQPSIVPHLIRPHVVSNPGAPFLVQKRPDDHPEISPEACTFPTWHHACCSDTEQSPWPLYDGDPPVLCPEQCCEQQMIGPDPACWVSGRSFDFCCHGPEEERAFCWIPLTATEG